MVRPGQTGASAVKGTGVSGETSFIPGPETTRAFRDALGRFATGVTVVTTEGAHGPVGITANSFAALSLDPPMVLWSPARASRRFIHFAEAHGFAIHILSQDQHPLAQRFVRADHHFEDLGLTRSPEGIPLLPGTLARFECRTAAVHEGGDHVIITGHVLHASFRDGDPLVFWAGRYGGFAPEI
ncbi:flavin reductase family protein [Thioclava sp. BHET1]|nr:flavin reductase family protein [Thioclava sp. BHET1]